MGHSGSAVGHSSISQSLQTTQAIRAAADREREFSAPNHEKGQHTLDGRESTDFHMKQLGKGVRSRSHIRHDQAIEQASLLKQQQMLQAEQYSPRISKEHAHERLNQRPPLPTEHEWADEERLLKADRLHAKNSKDKSGRRSVHMGKRSGEKKKSVGVSSKAASAMRSELYSEPNGKEEPK